MEIERPGDTRPALPNPRAIDTVPVEFKVLTEETLLDGPGWVYYGLTVENYEALSRNMAEILRWIKEARWRLDYYRNDADLNGVQDVSN